VLAESVLPPRGARLDSGAVVLGIGLNVHQVAAELPPPPPGGLAPVSMALLGARVARTRVLVALLDALGARYLAWCAASADDRTLADDYTRRCVTVGSAVRVHLPGGAVRAGRADGIDRAGHLLVDGVAVTAGDVEHVRPG
jgi:BirA family biotin operon repressor/biotin-[acetyl-CoA-carboxylase] ligase